MKTFLLSFLLALPALSAEEGFTPLFNGNDLTGWKSVGGKGTFEVTDGHIVGTGKDIKENTFLRTEATYKNFELRFEFKFDTLAGNSGVMFRGLQKSGENGRVFGYQCELDQDKKRAWSAGIYDEARRGWLHPTRNDTAESKALQKAFTQKGRRLFKWDDWNEVTIIADHKRLRIYLNGELRTDYTDENPEHFTPEGFIALQVHSGKSCQVRWRNLMIKELRPDD